MITHLKITTTEGEVIETGEPLGDKKTFEFSDAHEFAGFKTINTSAGITALSVIILDTECESKDA